MITYPLKMVQPYEIIKCDLSGECMFAGDWYYETPTGQRYLYESYHELRKKMKNDAFSYNDLYNAKSQEEYKKMLKQYEKELTNNSVLKEIENELMGGQ